jgi:hypothetical protein
MSQVKDTADKYQKEIALKSAIARDEIAVNFLHHSLQYEEWGDIMALHPKVTKKMSIKLMDCLRHVRKLNKLMFVNVGEDVYEASSQLSENITLSLKLSPKNLDTLNATIAMFLADALEKQEQESLLLDCKKCNLPELVLVPKFNQETQTGSAFIKCTLCNSKSSAVKGEFTSDHITATWGQWNHENVKHTKPKTDE